MPSGRDPNSTLVRLRLRGFVVVLALVAGMVLPAAPATASAGPQVRPAYLGGMEWSVLRNVNWVRSRFGLRPLRPDGRLTAAAEAHTNDMASHFYYAHDSLNGGAWWARIRRYIHAEQVAETLNYIVGPRSSRREPKTIVRSWMNSPPHRAILLARGLRRIGIARQSTHRPGRPAFYTADYASLH
ncbi:MAG TPA: CAP domain-containing protein [Solirubrobacteraceae bacterium]|jgi:uncharacterized protein YkwD|nr:CAP domain-containing protein [Solirubrobacteraceae bacterium]